jgi:hypothetical protein
MFKARASEALASFVAVVGEEAVCSDCCCCFSDAASESTGAVALARPASVVAGLPGLFALSPSGMATIVSSARTQKKHQVLRGRELRLEP